jgi:glycosyltransferase involved in cell wall biosynthesis
MPFLKETLTSVFNQTHENMEVIVIDDGSTDGSFEYGKSLSQKNFSIHKNKGKGACAARNYGYELSSGKYIQFLDADDLMDADKIEKQVLLLKKHPNNIAVCSTSHFYDEPTNGKIVDTPFMFSTDQPHEFLLKLYGGDGQNHNMVQTSAWLTPRSLIEKGGLWQEDIAKNQDGEFFCRMVMCSKGVRFSPDTLNYYRKHPKGKNIGNLGNRKHRESELKVAQIREDQLKDYANTDAYKKAFALQYQLIAINAYPKYKDISKTASNRVKALGGTTFLPVLGGKIIETIKYVFGWRAAKKVWYWLH